MFKTNPVSLKELLDDVESGKIQLPDFQRGWVWDDDRIRGLLASISRGFPVGAIMTLEAGGEIRLKSRMIEGAEENAGNRPDAFLLDGQQRLTSLYQSLRHEDAVDTHDNRGRRIRRWYYINMLAAMDPTVDREDAIVSVPENRRETRHCWQSSGSRCRGMSRWSGCTCRLNGWKAREWKWVSRIRRDTVQCSELLTA